MKAPIFSAYAKTPAAVADTLNTLASTTPPIGQPSASCPRCDDTNHHKIGHPADFWPAHQCRTCQSTDQQPQ